MSDLGQVLELMHSSSQRWSSLRLFGFEWRHLETFGRAWEHHTSELRKSGSVSVRAIRFHRTDGGSPPNESRERWRVWLAKPNKRRAQFLVGDHVVMAVFIGGLWWSWSPSRFRTNNGAPNHGHGFGPAGALVDPARHLASLEMQVESPTTFLSRPAFLVSATPRTGESHGLDPTLHLLGTGADHYKLIVDAEVGVLLRCEAEFRGDAFRVIEADQIGINEQFSDRTFDPELLRAGITDS